VASSGLLALLHGFVSIRFKTDQIISGTVINILALGLTGYFYRQYLAQNIPAGPGTFHFLIFRSFHKSRSSDPSFLWAKTDRLFHDDGDAADSLCVVLYAVGLRTRAVGENPRAADTLASTCFACNTSMY